MTKKQTKKNEKKKNEKEKMKKKMKKKHATSMLSRSVHYCTPKGFFFWGGRYVILEYFHEFLRWDHKILHADSWKLSGPFGRILAGRILFPATNLILNFIFFQKFLQFLAFLGIFLKCRGWWNCQNMKKNFALVLLKHQNKFWDQKWYQTVKN